MKNQKEKDELADSVLTFLRLNCRSKIAAKTAYYLFSIFHKVSIRNNYSSANTDSYRSWMYQIKENLRRRGKIICSCRSGYYYPVSAKEAEKYCKELQLRGRKMMITAAHTAKSYGRKASRKLI